MRKVAVVVMLSILLMIAAGCMNKPTNHSPKGEPIRIDEINITQDQELEGELIIALSTYESIMAGGLALRDPAELMMHHNQPIYRKINEFMALHPKVNIQIQLTSWYTGDPNVAKQYWPDFSVMPDIIELTPQQVRWAADDQLEDLYFYLENFTEESWEHDYIALLDAAAIGFNHYLLPVRSDPMIVFYSTVIFDQFGIPYPEEGWMWQDFFAIQEQVNRAEQVSAGLLNMANIEHIVESLGGSYMSVDGEHYLGALDSAATYDALQTYVDQVDLGVLAHIDPGMIDGYLKHEFPAFGIVRSSKADFAFEEVHVAPREYRLAGMPQADDGKMYNTAYITGLAMTKQAEDKQLAWELMRYIVGAEREAPMSFVTENTFRMHYENLIRKDTEGNIIELDREKKSQLLQLIRSGAPHAKVSSFNRVPTYVGGKADELFEVPWEFEPHDDLQTYLDRLAVMFEKLREEMIRDGLGSVE